MQSVRGRAKKSYLYQIMWVTHRVRLKDLVARSFSMSYAETRGPVGDYAVQASMFKGAKYIGAN